MAAESAYEPQRPSAEASAGFSYGGTTSLGHPYFYDRDGSIRIFVPDEEQSAVEPVVDQSAVTTGIEAVATEPVAPVLPGDTGYIRVAWGSNGQMKVEGQGHPQDVATHLRGWLNGHTPSTSLEPQQPALASADKLAPVFAGSPTYQSEIPVPAKSSRLGRFRLEKMAYNINYPRLLGRVAVAGLLALTLQKSYAFGSYLLGSDGAEFFNLSSPLHLVQLPLGDIEQGGQNIGHVVEPGIKFGAGAVKWIVRRVG